MEPVPNNPQISCSGQRIVITDSNGRKKRYRMVVRSNAKQIPLDKEAAEQAAKVAVSILKESKTLDASLDLTTVKIKDGCVESSAASKKLSGQANVSLNSIIVNSERKHVAQEKEIAEEPFTPHQETDFSYTHSKHKPTPSFIHSLFEKIRQPTGAKKLSEILNVIKEVEIKQGKIRMVGVDTIQYSPSEPGENGRKGTGKKSQEALIFVLQLVHSALSQPEPSEIDVQTSGEILKILQRNSWAIAVLKNYPFAREVLEEALKSYSNATKDKSKYLRRDALFDLILSNPQIRADFLISYRLFFENSLDMLNALKTYRDRQTANKADWEKIAPQKNCLDLITDWLSDDAINGQEYLDERITETITSFFTGSLPATEYKINELLAGRGERARISTPELTAENQEQLSWPDEARALREGKIKGSHYAQFVRDFAADFASLHVAHLKYLNPHDLLHKRLRDSNLYTQLKNDLEHFIVSEVLGPVNQEYKLQHAITMYTFFMDIQAELLKRNYFDAALTIRSALQHSTITRLNLLSKLPAPYMKFQQDLDQLVIHPDYASHLNPSTPTPFLPVYGDMQREIDFIEKTMEPHSVNTLNKEMMSVRAAIMLPILNAQKNLPVTPLKIPFYQEINHLPSSWKREWKNSHRLLP